MAAGLLEVARVACELGGEAGRGAKGTLAGICASVWAQQEKVLLGTASETSGERNPQLRGLQQFAVVSFPSC